MTVSGGQQRDSATHTHTHTYFFLSRVATIVDLLTYVQIISMCVNYRQTQNIINVFYVYLCANHKCVSFTIRLKTFFFSFCKFTFYRTSLFLKITHKVVDKLLRVRCHPWKTIINLHSEIPLPQGAHYQLENLGQEEADRGSWFHNHSYNPMEASMCKG